MTKGRILVAMFGTDQHELGAVAVAGLLRDNGFEVLYLGRFQILLRQSCNRRSTRMSISLASAAIRGNSSTMFRELTTLLAEHRVDAPVVLGGSVITTEDAQAMMVHGVTSVFGSASRSETILETISALATQRRTRVGVG